MRLFQHKRRWTYLRLVSLGNVFGKTNLKAGALYFGPRYFGSRYFGLRYFG